MTLKQFLNREKHVALHGQPKSFRIKKWVVIFIVATGLYIWKDWLITLEVFLACALLGICLHFFLRYKTNGWTKSWGPYKRIKLNDE